MKPLPRRLPAYSADLVKILDKTVPHRCPARGEDAEDVHRYAGKRELVDLLMARIDDEYEERNDKNMNWIDGDA